MNMKKLLLLVFTNVILSLVFAGCSSVGKSASKEDEQESIKRLENLKPISEVSQNAYNDLQEAKSKAGKLIYEDIKPYCPNIDKVYDIKIDGTGNYKNIDNEKDMLEELFTIIEVLLGKPVEELDMEHFETNYYNLAEKGNYKSFEEFKNDTQENDKREPSYLSYAEHDETKLLGCYIWRNLCNLSFDRGKCYEAMHDYRMVHESGATTTDPSVVCETVKTYYIYSNSDNFEDKWKLADGEMSVIDGINFVEDYLNNKMLNDLQLEDYSDEIKLKVESVDVIKINENYYCFGYSIRLEIGGVVFPSENGGYSRGSIDCTYDLSYAYQIERDSIDMYWGHTRRQKFNKLNETEEILSLSDAINIIESNIGENSKYTVNGIELGYLYRYINDMEQTEATGTVCWVFSCINELDGFITEFYVNAQTGEIKTNSRHP